MGAMTAIALGAGIMGATSSVMQGNQAKLEYEQQSRAYQMQQAGYNEQADLLEIEIAALDQKKVLEGSRYARQRRRVEGTVIARTAKSGFKLSGSPLTVLLDDLSQLELDESIGQFNIEMEKFNVRGEQYQLRSGAIASGSSAASARSSGKLATKVGYTNAFSSLLSTGAYLKSRMPIEK